MARPADLSCRAAIGVGLMLVAALMTGASPPATARDGARVTDAIVQVKATIPPDARTAGTLGTRRQGSGVVIDAAGLVLTVGHVVLEADAVTVTDHAGGAWPARIVAYDHESGFGLLRASPLPVPPLALGRSGGLTSESPVLVAAYGDVRPARIADRRPFAGYWEYLLDAALFTYPPHPGFAGAALIDGGGRLVGIGSLVVRDAAAPTDRRVLPGNMFIPIDALADPFPDLLAHGRRAGPYRPWIGLYGMALHDRVFVNHVADGGPAGKAGVRPGDLVVGINGKPVSSLADMYRALWSSGDAGVTVPVTVLRGLALETLDVVSIDRYRWLKLGRSH